MAASPVRAGAVTGEGCTIGRGASIDANEHVGRYGKVQNDALAYGLAVVGDGVFIDPATLLPNDAYLRAVNPDGSPKNSQDWDPVA